MLDRLTACEEEAKLVLVGNRNIPKQKLKTCRVKTAANSSTKQLFERYRRCREYRQCFLSPCMRVLI